MRILIIGAGPTGLGAAYRLAEQGINDFAVYDGHPYPGGLATTFRDEEGYLWDFAVHVAHSHYTYFDQLMEKLLPDGFYHHIRKSWVRTQDVFIPYPFQYNIRHLPGQGAWECVEGLLRVNSLNVNRESASTTSPRITNNDSRITTFKDWVLNTFGSGIAQHFMVPYNEKIWCTRLAEMGCQWIGDRVPAVDLDRVLKSIALEQDDVSWGPNATFQFPKEGGTGAIWRKLAAQIPPEQLHLSCSMTSLDVKNRTATFADGTVEPYDYLISTMPITTLIGMTGIGELADRVKGLRHTRVTVVGVAPQQPMPADLEDKTWIYCPEDRCGFYRVTPFSNFSPDHVPNPDTSCSFLCEFSVAGDRPHQEEDLTADALDGLRAVGLIDCDPETTHSYVMHADHGYPVPTHDRDAILEEVIPALEDLHILSRGRFGGWKYEVANMDHSVMQGVEAADRILSGAKEVTLFSPNVVNAGKR